MSRYKVEGIDCNSCKQLIRMSIEDWEGTELVEENGEFFLNIPEEMEQNKSDIIAAVEIANPAHEDKYKLTAI